jgi:hypothetical protein
MPMPNDPISPNRHVATPSPRNSSSLKWYLPTFHGDILLTRKDPQTTLVRVFELTDMEEKALDILRQRATRKGTFSASQWADEKEFAPVSNPQYRTKDGLVITLKAKIEDVEKVLAKALNPKGRPLFTAVKFTDGSIEKVHRVPDAEDGTRVPLIAGGTKPKDDDAIEGEIVDEEELREKEEKKAKEKAEKAKKEPKAAATAKQPVIGCPTPEFPEADIRATKCLIEFLEPKQIDDWLRHGAFVTTGRDTGHRYMIFNREAPLGHRGQFKNFTGGASFSGLYDLDEERSLCVHDWDVPPAEEALALHLCLSIVGFEKYVRSLPHAYA